MDILEVRASLLKDLDITHEICDICHGEGEVEGLPQSGNPETSDCVTCRGLGLLIMVDGKEFNIPKRRR